MFASAQALPEVSWSRVAPELASAIAAPLGPSHRGAVVVLQQLPTSSSPRLAALRQAAALQLMYSLCKHPQVCGCACGEQGAGRRRPWWLWGWEGACAWGLGRVLVQTWREWASVED